MGEPVKLDCRSKVYRRRDYLHKKRCRGKWASV